MRWDYLSRLSLAARWYLPPAEAAEVLEDYREIVEGRSEEELRREVGGPSETVRRLAQPKAYRRWLTVFGILSVCVILPAIAPLWRELSYHVLFHECKLYRLYWFVDIGEKVIPFAGVFYITGMALSLVWFRRNCRREPAVSKGIWPLLALLLAGMAWVWFLGWAIVMERWDIIHFLAPTEGRGVLMRLALGADISAMGMLGVFGLVKSRLNGRRWGAVYVLGLAGAILGLSVWALMTCLALPFDASAVEWLLWRYAFITLAGLLGTGVSLC